MNKSNLVYDQIQQQFIHSEQSRLVFENDQMQQVRVETLNLEEEFGEVDSRKKAESSQQYFADTWNVLRFIKGSKPNVQISPDGKYASGLRFVGLTLVVVNKNSGPKTEEELVLTNMAFTHGMHVWQINATIGCTNICKCVGTNFIQRWEFTAR